MITSWLYYNDKNLTTKDLPRIWEEARREKVEFLDISGNHFSGTVQFPHSLPDLKVLEMSGNKEEIEEVVMPPFIFSNLEHLYLQNSQIKSLRIDSELEKIEYVYLYGNPIKNIPKEIFDKEKENVAEAVKNYFFAMNQGQVINTEAKIVLIGNGESGKTTLSHQFRKKEFIHIPPEKRTHGILIEEWQVPEARFPESLKKKINEEGIGMLLKNGWQKRKRIENICLFLWDFGGQEYYHATHRLFLNSNVLYLLVWDEKIEKQDHDKGIHPHDYWKKNINHYAPENLTLMVQNKATVRAVVDSSNLMFKVCFRDENDNLSIQQYNLDITSLEKAILEQLVHLPHLAAPFPSVYDHIRSEVRNMGKDYLLYKDYVKFCREKDNSPDQIMQESSQIDTLTKFLHETGVIICYRYEKDCPATLRNYVFTNPAWVTDTIYKILDKENVLKKEGEFDDKHVEDVVFTLSTSLNPNDWIDLMKRFELIFEIKKDNQSRYIAPQYLPMNSKKSEREKSAASLPLVFSLHYPDFMPKSNFLRFISKYGSASKNYWYWKKGLIFQHKGQEVFASCDYENRSISIQMQKSDPSFTAELFTTLYEIDKTESLEVSANGADFVPYKLLMENQKFGGCSYKGKDFMCRDFGFLLGIGLKDVINHNEDMDHIDIPEFFIAEMKKQFEEEYHKMHRFEKLLSSMKEKDLRAEYEEEIELCDENITRIEKRYLKKIKNRQPQIPESDIQKMINELREDISHRFNKLNDHLALIHQSLTVIEASINESAINSNPEDKQKAEELLQEILKKLETNPTKDSAAIDKLKGDISTGAKLKLAIPLIPGILQYESDLLSFSAKESIKSWKDLWQIFVKKN